MFDLIHSSSPLPLPSANITTRIATMDDLPAIDALQKLHHKQLGFFPRAQLAGYVSNGWVVVAEDAGGRQSPAADAAGATASRSDALQGYCASRDRYLKRDELGAIFQLCVAPGRQRSFIGANLLKSVFDRSAYGTRLYCCWCAQDLAANHFWEAMGFVPLAYRAGSEKRGRKGGARVHIFWQKRIRAGDVTMPWWFPSKTEGGAIREDRIVLPIPPGTHWSQAKPLILPNANDHAPIDEPKQLRTPRKQKAIAPVAAITKRRCLAGALTFATAPPTALAIAATGKPRRHRQAKAKTDPRLIAAARELRDRWLEQINQVPLSGQAKYAIGRVPPVQEEQRRLAA